MLIILNAISAISWRIAELARDSSILVVVRGEATDRDPSIAIECRKCPVGPAIEILLEMAHFLAFEIKSSITAGGV